MPVTPAPSSPLPFPHPTSYPHLREVEPSVDAPRWSGSQKIPAPFIPPVSVELPIPVAEALQEETQTVKQVFEEAAGLAENHTHTIQADPRNCLSAAQLDAVKELYKQAAHKDKSARAFAKDASVLLGYKVTQANVRKASQFNLDIRGKFKNTILSPQEENRDKIVQIANAMGPGPVNTKKLAEIAGEKLNCRVSRNFAASVIRDHDNLVYRQSNLDKALTHQQMQQVAEEWTKPRHRTKGARLMAAWYNAVHKTEYTETNLQRVRIKFGLAVGRAGKSVQPEPEAPGPSASQSRKPVSSTMGPASPDESTTEDPSPDGARL